MNNHNLPPFVRAIENVVHESIRLSETDGVWTYEFFDIDGWFYAYTAQYNPGTDSWNVLAASVTPVQPGREEDHDDEEEPDSPLYDSSRDYRVLRTEVEEDDERRYVGWGMREGLVPHEEEEEEEELTLPSYEFCNSGGEAPPRYPPPSYREVEIEKKEERKRKIREREIEMEKRRRIESEEDSEDDSWLDKSAFEI